MDDALEYFLTQFKPMPNAKAFPENIFKKYESKLPNKLLEYWREMGLCGFNNGSFWFTNPDDYTELLEILLEGKKTFRPEECFVFARSAFGHLHIWCDRIGAFYISVAELRLCFDASELTAMSIDKHELKMSSRLASLQPSDSPNIDILDDDGNYQLKRAQKKLGTLEIDECYGFFPALPFGGSRRIENLQKVKLHEHLMMVAQMDSLRIINVDQFPPTQVE